MINTSLLVLALLIITSLTIFLFLKLRSNFDAIKQGDLVTVYDRTDGHLKNYPVVVVNDKKYYIKENRYVEFTIYDLFSGKVMTDNV